jgi:hypothetical protein
MTEQQKEEEDFDIRKLIVAPRLARPAWCSSLDYGYTIYLAEPAKGVLYVTERSKHFISGHVRMLGKTAGQYPYHYLDMINSLFGPDDNTIEVCSGGVLHDAAKTTVDIKTDFADFKDDAQNLLSQEDETFTRWRCDPPYNEETAKKMYGTDVPVTRRLLYAAERVCKPGSLMFLLLGPQNYQWAPLGCVRVGWMGITVVPSNELRALHIYYKYEVIPRKEIATIDDFVNTNV